MQAGTAGAPTEPVSIQQEQELPSYTFSYQSGVLWSVGNHAGPLDYVLAPQILSLRTPEMFGTDLGGGRLSVRNRFDLLAVGVIEGPENYFFGITAAPSIEWRIPNCPVSYYFSAGGGVGFMDAKGYSVPGGQGQDFNLTWFISTGLEFSFGNNWIATLGVYYQHISNGGMDDVNPGIDALGPVIGVGYQF